MPVTTGHFSHLVFCGHRTFLLYCLNSRPARSRGKLYGYAPSQQFNPFYSNGAKIRPWHTLQVKMLICLTPFSEGRKLNSNVSRFALYLLPSAKDLLAFDSQRLQNGKGLPSHKLRPRFTMQLITHLTWDIKCYWCRNQNMTKYRGPWGDAWVQREMEYLLRELVRQTNHGHCHLCIIGFPPFMILSPTHGHTW